MHTAQRFPTHNYGFVQYMIAHSQRDHSYVYQIRSPDEVPVSLFHSMAIMTDVLFPIPTANKTKHSNQLQQIYYCPRKQQVLATLTLCTAASN